MSEVDRRGPTEWKLPEWHPAWNVNAEFEMLRALSVAILAQEPRIAVELEVTEPGYMHVNVLRQGACLAKVLIVGRTSPGQKGRLRYAAFLMPNEIELYADDIEGMISAIQKTGDHT